MGGSDAILSSKCSRKRKACKLQVDGSISTHCLFCKSALVLSLQSDSSTSRSSTSDACGIDVDAGAARASLHSFTVRVSAPSVLKVFQNQLIQGSQCKTFCAACRRPLCISFNE